MKPLHLTMIAIFLLSITFVLPSVQGITGSALFMKTNSTAKIYANFTLHVLSNETLNLTQGLYLPAIYSGMNESPIQIDSKNMTIVVDPSSISGDKNNTAVTYTITAKNNTKGVYAMFLYFCGLQPLVVGLNESQVNPEIFNKYFTAVYNCPMETASTPVMNIVGYSGIISKLIAVNANNTITVYPQNTSSPNNFYQPFPPPPPVILNQSSPLPPLPPALQIPVYPLPLKQFKTGTLVNDVKCNDGLQLIIKSEDGTPACVKSDTAGILMGRGWAINVTYHGPWEYSGPRIPLKHLLSTNSTNIKPTPTVINGTKALDACNYFGFPCSQNPSFAAEKFGSSIYVAKAAMYGRDYYMLLGEHDTCIYPGINGHVSCSNPDDIAILKLAGANIVNIPEDIDVKNHTLTLGDIKYSIASFEPNRTVNLDGMTFVYTGNGSAIRGDCYGTWVNQTEGRSFSIYGGNEFDENAFQCWPPLQYPTQIEENGKLLDISPLLYSISFFDINQTVGIAWCNSDTCSMGDGFYLVKQGWHTPTIYDSPSVLKFYLQTNASIIHAGQTIGVYLGDNNTQPRPVKLPFPWHFGFHGSSLFPCDYEPTTIAIFQGYLSQENLNSTESLDLYRPAIYSCPAPYAGKTWTFQALSNIATLQCDIGEYCNDTRTMSQHIPLDGYWDSSDHFHLFEEGNYTIAGGDQWGHVAILHFSVVK